MQNLFKPRQALLALVMVLTATLTYGQTQSGTLDPSFGSGGKVINDFGGRIALQPDGKMVAAGGAVNPTDGFDFAVFRFNANGTLDTTFGSGGKTTTDLGGRFEGATSIALQPDGKIIAGGYAVVPVNQFANFALVRYNSDGSLDLSFGTGGKVITSFGNISAQAYSMALQPDGKIVLAGYVNFNGGESFALARYNTNGTLDAGFGTSGKVHTEFSAVGQTGSLAFANSVALQQDGKIVAAGESTINGQRDFALARYNSNGTLDPGFGTGGKVNTDFMGFDDLAYDVTIQPDGRIVAAGAAATGTAASVLFDFALARYNSNGTLDRTFGTSGKVTTDFSGAQDFVRSVVLQADGKIIAAGQATINGLTDAAFGLARYLSDGTLDAAFGTGGRVTTNFGPGQDQIGQLVLLQDGKILAAGGADINGTSKSVLVRYLNDTSSGTPAASQSTTENVSWTNLAGATASGNSVTKTAATAWGNAGASSTRSIASGDGYVQFSVASANTGMMGLSHTDANWDYSSIDFALLAYADGNLYVYESGIFRGAVGSFTTGDVFRVGVEGGVVKYRKNGTVIYTSSVAPTYPLLGDAALYGNGGSFTNAVISGNLTGGAALPTPVAPASTTENVSWTNLVGATASGNSVTKTAATAWGNAGASSTRSIVSGDGYVQFSVTPANTGMMGLSHIDANPDYSSIDFALLAYSDGNLYVYESGVFRGAVGTFTAGDVFRVGVEGGVVKYRKNGTVIYTSSVAPTYPLLGDAALYLNGGSFTNAVLSGNLNN